MYATHSLPTRFQNGPVYGVPAPLRFPSILSCAIAGMAALSVSILLFAGAFVAAEKVNVCEAAGAPEKVEAAVRKGRGWLLSALENKNFCHQSYPMGIRSLYLYALLNAGADPAHPVIRNTLNRINEMPPRKTYSVALHLMALDQWGRAGARVKLLRLGEDPAGFSFLGENRKRAEELLSWLLRAKHKDRPHWDYAGGGNRYDYSNSQFAISALDAGLRNRLKVPPGVLVDVELTFPATMSPPVATGTVRAEVLFGKLERGTGRRLVQSRRTLSVVPQGWGYQAKGSPRFSMTCAGLSNLAVAEQGLAQESGGERDSASGVLKAMWAAMAYVATSWSDLESLRPAVKRAKRRYYYTVYSLEKAGDLWEVLRFGSHNWYTEEASFLLKDQYEDGHWGRNGWEGVATSFSLLFLTRASARFRPFEQVFFTGSGKRRKQEDEELVYIDRLGGSVTVGSVLCAALENGDPGLLRMAQEAVSRFSEKRKGRLVPTLCLLARSGPGGTETFARRTLLRITGFSTTKLDKYERWAALWEEIRSIRRSSNKKKAGRLCEIAAIRSTHFEGLRISALSAVKRLKAAGVMDKVLPLLKDKSPRVREGAFECLKALSGADLSFPVSGSASEREKAYKELADWLREEGPGLARRKKVDSALKEFLSPEPPSYSREALSVLKKYPGEAVSALIEKLKGDSVDYRIFFALREVTGKDFGLYPSKWRKWGEKEGRKEEGRKQED